MDIKNTLLDLSDRLIKKHNFSTAKPHAKEPKKDTTTIYEFILWLDKTPEARQELENMGLTFLTTNQFCNGVRNG